MSSSLILRLGKSEKRERVGSLLWVLTGAPGILRGFKERGVEKRADSSAVFDRWTYQSARSGVSQLAKRQFLRTSIAR